MRTPPLLRAVVAVAVGSLGVAAGAGIGLRHVAVAGPTATGAVATACGVVGLVLLVWGAAVLVRRLPGWWRLVAVPGALLVVLLWIFPLAVALAATNVPPTTVGDRTPADRGLAYEDARFTTVDGVTLRGWYLPTRDGAAVLLLHGATSMRADVLDQAEVLNRHGFGVLAFDARGHGESGGRAMDFGWYGDLDAEAAVGWLTEQPAVDDDRIGAVGLSMGGEEVLGAAASDRRIAAVVAEGATGRVRGDRGWLPHGVPGWVQRRIDWVQFTLVDALTDARPPITLRDAVAEIAPRPVLLVVAGDVPDEGEAAAWIAAGAPASVEVWEVEGAGHTGGLRTAPEAWEDRVVGFLDESLGA